MKKLQKALIKFSPMKLKSFAAHEEQKNEVPELEGQASSRKIDS